MKIKERLSDIFSELEDDFLQELEDRGEFDDYSEGARAKAKQKAKEKMESALAEVLTIN